MKYIAYSIFGTDRRYFDGLLQCIESASELYDGWRVVVFADEALDPGWRDQLDALPVVLECRTRRSLWDGLYWRFEIFDREDCESAIIRDADSMLTPREASLVHAWERSGADLHIIRDHPDHEWPMNAGMWGARNIFDFSMSERISQWAWKDAKFGDQHFLRKQVYRVYYKLALVHSSCIAYRGEQVEWIEPVEDFIGRVYFAEPQRVIQTEPQWLLQPSFWREMRWYCELLWRKLETKCLRARSPSR